MDFSKIKRHSLAVLEQACERYAIMTFETLNGRLAIGLRSITYSYFNHGEREGMGTFRAIFLPWERSDMPSRQNRGMGLEWDIEALPDGRWRLSNGLVSVQNEPGGRDIEWSEDGLCMAFRHQDHVAYSYDAENKHLHRLDSVTF